MVRSKSWDCGLEWSSWNGHCCLLCPWWTGLNYLYSIFDLKCFCLLGSDTCFALKSALIGSHKGSCHFYNTSGISFWLLHVIRYIFCYAVALHPYFFDQIISFIERNKLTCKTKQKTSTIKRKSLDFRCFNQTNFLNDLIDVTLYLRSFSFLSYWV
jgi:hypothetical protein